MPSYLLDTTNLIDLSRGTEPTQSHIQSLIDAGNEMGICAVVVAEYFSGVPPEKRTGAAVLLDTLRDWAISRDVAIQAGIYRYTYARLGRAISAPDALIAATAVSVGATLVTNNVKDFPMPDVRLLRIGP